MTAFGIVALLCLAAMTAASSYDASSNQFPESTLIDSEGSNQATNTQRQLDGCTPVVLDFDTDGNGRDLDKGDYVKDEWKEKFGISIKARGRYGGYTPQQKARIFKTSHPGGALHLGSPNEKCGGPGVGSGGEPGSSWSNCHPQGAVLIIQGSDRNVLQDYSGGGWISFYFKEPTDVKSIGLMDIRGAGTKVIYTVSSGHKTEVHVPGRGTNSVQDFHFDGKGVVRVQVSFKNHGAITSLSFCHPSSVYEPHPNDPPKPPADDKSRSGCGAGTVLETNDFEGDKALDGWTNGKLDYDHGFTRFLGRFVGEDSDPQKKFEVPKDAEHAVLSFDFYEIDSWNGVFDNSQDALYVYINHEEVYIGTFKVTEDEGSWYATSAGGIRMDRKSQGPPRHIGFRNDGLDVFKDQIHHVELKIPSSFYAADGHFTLRIDTRITAKNIHDESAGFDNFKLTAFGTCKNKATPHPTPKGTPRPTPYPTGRPTLKPTRRHLPPCGNDPYRFNICLDFSPTVSPHDADAFLAAAQRWETIVTGDLEPRTYANSGADLLYYCRYEPSFPDLVVDDVDVCVNVVPLDGPGRIVAIAGPAAIRDGVHTPIFGIVLIDAADIQQIRDSGTFNDYALHELGEFSCKPTHLLFFIAPYCNIEK